MECKVQMQRPGSSISGVHLSGPGTPQFVLLLCYDLLLLLLLLLLMSPLRRQRRGATHGSRRGRRSRARGVSSCGGAALKLETVAPIHGIVPENIQFINKIIYYLNLPKL